jgi:hypothetical protein
LPCACFCHACWARRCGRLAVENSFACGAKRASAETDSDTRLRDSSFSLSASTQSQSQHRVPSTGVPEEEERRALRSALRRTSALYLAPCQLAAPVPM